jgi:plasmid maintenance system antidote protein VapI
VSPGELLLEEFLLPMGITRYRLAKEIGVPAQRIGEIVAGRSAISYQAMVKDRCLRAGGLSNQRINLTRPTVSVVSSDRGPRRSCAVRWAEQSWRVSR